MNERLTPPDWDAFDSNMLINVGVNVHYASGETGAIRVYGGAVTAQATNMNKITR